MKRTLRLLSLMAGLLLVSSGVFAQQTWKELIANGNFEGSDLSNLRYKPIEGNDTSNLFQR